MAKLKTKYICQNCSYESPGFLGKCPDCSSWSSFVEEVYDAKPTTKKAVQEFSSNAPQTLNEISSQKSIRVLSGLSEFDRVVGGGIVKGSIILLSGEPGIGKSTLTLQVAGLLSKDKVLYASAEESSGQIKLRADRLGIKSDNLYISSETNLDEIKSQIKELRPSLLVIDSIQSIYTENITSSPGSVSQIRECCNLLMTIAKKLSITVLIIGHVTKEGTIAGPKVLEHMVDTVLYFEGEKYKTYRILRAVKNRFGSINEIGVFSMEEKGLEEVRNPSEMFLSERTNQTPGSVVIVANEGTRAVLVEIQALVGYTPYPSPRRVANGLEYNRVLQILAVLEKRVGLNLSKHDVYINAIGGMEVREPAADLGVALASASCVRNVAIDSETAIIGELGLSGEVRPVINVASRIKEAQKLGFKRAIVPKANLPIKENIKDIEIIGVSKLTEAVTAAISVK